MTAEPASENRRPTAMTNTSLLARFGKLLLVATAASMILAACGDGGGAVATPDAGPDTITITQDGGCRMMGPNCPTYQLDRDGTFRLLRTGEEPVVTESEIDPDTSAEVWQQLVEVDVAALVERAGPGSCQACVDGTDTAIDYTLDGAEVHLNSVDVAFDSSEPFFQVMGEAIEAMAAAAPMPIQQR